MSITRLSAALALALSPLPGLAAGTDPEIEVLKAQLAALQARVAELEATRGTAAGAPLVAAAPVQAQAGAQDRAEKPAARADTRGGIALASADGRFEASLGGRIHLDGYAFDRDLAASSGTTEFRRARLTLQGKAYGWDYKLEQDFAAGSNLEGLRDAYIARKALGGKLTIGHFKPYRSMEELTSSNEILMMERPFASATGLFSGRQFQQGVGYLRAGDGYTAGLSVFNLRNASGPGNEGHGVAGRVTFAPLDDDRRTVHLGAWFSREQVGRDSPDLQALANYAGRRGPRLTIAWLPGDGGGHVAAYGAEAAGAFGPLFLQGEYVQAAFGNGADVDAWYLQGSWHLNGGHKPYKSGTGVFGSAPVGGHGLWELTARYDSIENRDVAGRSAASWLMGVNYYPNPALRFMFNYTRGDNDETGDQTGQYALRTQFSF